MGANVVLEVGNQLENNSVVIGATANMTAKCHLFQHINSNIYFPLETITTPITIRAMSAVESLL